MNFVLDASVTLAWLFEDEGGAYALDVLRALQDGEAAAPSIWQLEVANGLLTAERHDRLSGGEVQRYGRLLLALPIVIDPGDRRAAFDEIIAIARRRKLTAYDAAYLHLAMRLDIPLATLNRGLMRAAQREGVERLVAAK